jgi:proton-dependent oligopeptide transporter, POT family
MNQGRTFLGHPIGLATLFFTEMWERFSYYGMRALLMLFMVASIERGGMGLDVKTAGAIYGLYTMFVYLLALPGGWLADNLFGLRKAVFYGGCIIAMGHICLALPFIETFFLGLMLIVIGTGLLKPNISSMVGELYSPDESSKRDAGFSIFYMGINLGAFSAPLLVSYLGEKVNWHYGFAAAGLGMIVGLIQYKLSEKNLGNIGAEPRLSLDGTEDKKRKQRLKNWLTGGAISLAVFVALLMTRVITINPLLIAQSSSVVIMVVLVLFFLKVFLLEKLHADEKKKLLVIIIFFLFSSVFWAGYEQQGSSLNLFAERYTDRFIGNWEMPAGWFQSAPPIYVILFSLPFAWLWVFLAKRKLDPNTPVKFSMGLLFMGLGFLLMMWASHRVIADGIVGPEAGPGWLIITYMLHTFGEICLYPTGLSSVTKLSPPSLKGQLMGIWFMSIAFGNLVAGLFAGEFDENAIIAQPAMLPDLFFTVVKITLAAGIVLLLFNKPIRKLMGNIR